jgi:hypothetical protein
MVMVTLAVQVVALALLAEESKSPTCMGCTIMVISLALLLPVFGSMTPAGAVMVAVLVKVPEAVGETLAVRVKMALPLAGIFTSALRLPVPLAGQDEPGAAEQVHVAPERTAGKVSVTRAPATASGPALETPIVYVTVPPAATTMRLRVLLMDRFAVGSVSVSVALLLVGFGSVTPAGTATLAVLEIEPVALFETVALAV